MEYDSRGGSSNGDPKGKLPQPVHSNAREGVTSRNELAEGFSTSEKSGSWAMYNSSTLTPLPSKVLSTNPTLGELPELQRDKAQAAILAQGYSEFMSAVTALMKIGGMESVKALACILSEATSDCGALANLSMGGRNVTVYTLCKALLKTAGATRLAEYENFEPGLALSRDQKADVWKAVRFLAKGDHGDIETATGARTLLFERAARIPGVGRALDLLLRVSTLIDGAPSGGPSRLLFALYDLPWMFRSKLPFASTDSRKDNLAEMLFRGTGSN